MISRAICQIGIYFEALDLLMNGIYSRLIKQVTIKIYTNLQNMLFKTVSGGHFLSESLSTWSFYGSHISRERLETQLTILKMHAQESSIASVSSMIEFLNENGVASFSETATVLVKLILVMPATNALSKSSYSASRRIKNYLRSTMTQKGWTTSCWYF